MVSPGASYITCIMSDGLEPTIEAAVLTYLCSTLVCFYSGFYSTTDKQADAITESVLQVSRVRLL